MFQTLPKKTAELLQVEFTGLLASGEDLVEVHRG